MKIFQITILNEETQFGQMVVSLPNSQPKIYYFTNKSGAIDLMKGIELRQQRLLEQIQIEINGI